MKRKYIKIRRIGEDKTWTLKIKYIDLVELNYPKPAWRGWVAIEYTGEEAEIFKQYMKAPWDFDLIEKWDEMNCKYCGKDMSDINKDISSITTCSDCLNSLFYQSDSSLAPNGNEIKPPTEIESEQRHEIEVVCRFCKVQSIMIDAKAMVNPAYACGECTQKNLFILKTARPVNQCNKDDAPKSREELKDKNLDGMKKISSLEMIKQINTKEYIIEFGHDGMFVSASWRYDQREEDRDHDYQRILDKLGFK